MIRVVVAGHAVDEYGKPVTVIVQPGDDVLESRRIELELTTSALMRPHQLFMEAPDFHLEFRARGRA